MMMSNRKQNKDHNHKTLPRYLRLTSSDLWIEPGGVGGVVRKGYVPVMVGGEGVKERYLIPTQLMAHPSVLALLDLSAEEFGYEQQGVLQIPCDPDYFRDVIKSLSMDCRTCRRNVLRWAS